MSKKPKKPRTTTKQAATPQKSTRAVRGGNVEASEPNSAETRESAPDPAETVHDAVPQADSAMPLEQKPEEASTTPSAEPKPATEAIKVGSGSEQAQAPVSVAPVSHAIQYQSLIPPTEDIDVGWGADEADAAPGGSAPVLVAPASAQETGKTAVSANPDVLATPEHEASSSAATAGASAAKTQDKTATAPRVSERTSSEASNAAHLDAASRPSADSAARRSLTPADGVAAARSFSAPPSSSRPSAQRPSSAPVSKGPVSVRSSVPPEAGSATASGLRRPGPTSVAPSFTAPPASRPPASADAAADSVRPSRAPGSLRPAAGTPGESRPSRSAGALHSSVAPRSPIETPIASTQPEPTPIAPVATGAALEQQSHGAGAAHETAASRPTDADRTDVVRTSSITDKNAPYAPGVSTASAATATPLAIEHPPSTAVSASRESPKTAREFAAPAALLESTPAMPSSYPPRSNRGPLWALMWLASLAAAGAAGWFAKPVPRPKPVNCDCTSAVQSGVRDAMLQQQRSIEAARAAAPAPTPTLAASTSEGAGGAGSESATTIGSSTAPSSTVPVVIETKSNDRIDVLVKSRPSNVKVWRLGKAIGRTPLVIQIGRGEHRIFEVGGPAVGVRRLSLNGDKTEVTVDLIPPGKPAK